MAHHLRRRRDGVRHLFAARRLQVSALGDASVEVWRCGGWGGAWVEHGRASPDARACAFRRLQVPGSRARAQRSRLGPALHRGRGGDRGGRARRADTPQHGLLGADVAGCAVGAAGARRRRAAHQLSAGGGAGGAVRVRGVQLGRRRRRRRCGGAQRRRRGGAVPARAGGLQRDDAAAGGRAVRNGQRPAARGDVLFPRTRRQRAGPGRLVGVGAAAHRGGRAAAAGRPVGRRVGPGLRLAELAAGRRPGRQSLRVRGGGAPPARQLPGIRGGARVCGGAARRGVRVGRSARPGARNGVRIPRRRGEPRGGGPAVRTAAA
eukprot:2822-Chlamydomonas_euryale.AAC.1